MRKITWRIRTLGTILCTEINVNLCTYTSTNWCVWFYYRQLVPQGKHARIQLLRDVLSATVEFFKIPMHKLSTVCRGPPSLSIVHHCTGTILLHLMWKILLLWNNNFEDFDLILILPRRKNWRDTEEYTHVRTYLQFIALYWCNLHFFNYILTANIQFRAPRTNAHVRYLCVYVRVSVHATDFFLKNSHVQWGHRTINVSTYVR